MNTKKRFLIGGGLFVGLAIGFYGFTSGWASSRSSEHRAHGAVHYASCLSRLQEHLGDAFHEDERTARSKFLTSESETPRRWKWAVFGKGQYNGKETGFYCESWQNRRTGDFHIDGLVLDNRVLEGSPRFRTVAAGFMALR